MAEYLVHYLKRFKGVRHNAYVSAESVQEARRKFHLCFPEKHYITVAVWERVWEAHN